MRQRPHERQRGIGTGDRPAVVVGDVGRPRHRRRRSAGCRTAPAESGCSGLWTGANCGRPAERREAGPLNPCQGCLVLRRSELCAVELAASELEHRSRIDDARVIDLELVGGEVVALAHEAPARGRAGDIVPDLLREPRLPFDRQAVLVRRPVVEPRQVLTPGIGDAGLLVRRSCSPTRWCWASAAGSGARAPAGWRGWRE